MNYIVLSIAIFCIGIFGLLIRRNLIIMLMSIELMISAANILFVSFSRMRGSLDGDAIVLLVFVIAACEAAVGLAIIVSAWRLMGTVDISNFKEMKK